MEALILVINMGVMLYLCWRVFKGQGKADTDLGLLRFQKTDRQSCTPSPSSDFACVIWLLP